MPAELLLGLALDVLLLVAVFYGYYRFRASIRQIDSPDPTEPHRIELTDGYVLCQDCGHAEPWTTDRHQGREACPKCDGEFCGCDTCNALARLSVQFQDPPEPSQVKDTPASRTRRADGEAIEHRTGEDVAQRILDPPPTIQPP